MSAPIISAVTAALLLIVQQVLLLTVARQRYAKRQGIGHGEDLALECVIRRHGNFAENAAIFVITLALLELIVGSNVFVLVLAILFCIGRAMHIYAFSNDAGARGSLETKFYLRVRFYANIISVATCILTGLYLLVYLAIYAV
jgi:uncharacterized protein